MPESPTSRTLRALREIGYRAEVVEHWNSHARVRKDLFGCVDVLALRDGETLAVQATSGSNASARVRKLTEHEALADMREAGWTVQVYAWRKNSAGRWTCRIIDVT